MKNYKRYSALVLASVLCLSLPGAYLNVSAAADTQSTETHHANEQTNSSETTLPFLEYELTTDDVETTTATAPETSALPTRETTTYQVEEPTTSGIETTSTVEETTTAIDTPVKPPKKNKLSLKGTYQRKAVYAKKKIKAYNRYLKKVMVLKKGVRYYEVKRLKNGYSWLKVNGKSVYAKTKYFTHKCNAKKFVSTTDTKYSYKDMVKDIRQLKKAYGSILTAKVVGKSADKRNLYCITLGDKKAKKTIYIESTIHAREWKNSQLMMKLIEDICRNYDTASYEGKSYTSIFKKVKLVIMPMVNPDGVTISQYGANAIRNKNLRGKIIRVAHGNYATWKANARCVDLNRNFAEGFGYHGSKSLSSMSYPGATPLSEPETKAEVSVVKACKPVAVISFHEAGRVIYYRYNSRLLSLVRQHTHYQLYRESSPRYGSFSDYLDARGITNCTIENGLVPAPLQHWQFQTIYQRNKNILVAAAKLYR